MIPRSKFGDCSNPGCDEKNTNCVKVGRNLYCLKCRQKQKAKDQIAKLKTKEMARGLQKTQSAPKGHLDDDRTFLIQDLDTAFSQYVRKREALPSGLTECFTCSRSLDWKKMDCGHFISRKNLFLRWDLRNIRPQCKTCNQYNQGELATFALNLELEQAGAVSALLEDSKIIQKWTRDDLKEKLIDIRERLKIVNTKFKK